MRAPKRCTLMIASRAQEMSDKMPASQTSAADLSHIQQLHNYWRSLADGEAPDRNLLDPGAVKLLLPYICLVDFEMDPFRVHYRLSGSQVDEMNGFNLAGRYLDDIARRDPSGGATHILTHYRTCWETGRPSFSAYLWPTRSGNFLEVQFAMFPLLVQGQVRQCIAIEDWEYSVEPIAVEAVPFTTPEGGKQE
jgi:hypothetical protein